MVSSASIMGMTLTMIICFAVPITTMAVLKIRKHAQIFLFLVGISMHLFFVMLLEQLLLNLTVSAFPAMNAVGYSILSAITAGVFEILEFALISKVLRDTLDRGSRALMFGLGHATSNALLSSGLTSLTYYTIAMLVSTEGAETLTKGLSGEELKAMNQMIQTVTGDFLPFYLSGVEQLLLMAMYGCVAVLVWMAISSRLPIKWAGIAAVMLAAQRLLLDLGNTGAIPMEWLADLLAAAVTAAAIVVTRQIYQKIEGNTRHEERLSVRRLR